MKPGFYWCTDCADQRIIVDIDVINEGMPNEALRAWVTGEGVHYQIEEFTDYKPVRESWLKLLVRWLCQ